MACALEKPALTLRPSVDSLWGTDDQWVVILVCLDRGSG